MNCPKSVHKAFGKLANSQERSILKKNASFLGNCQVANSSLLQAEFARVLRALANTIFEKEAHFLDMFLSGEFVICQSFSWMFTRKEGGGGGEGEGLGGI